MKITIELYYETEWIARGKGIYITGHSLLEIRERLLAFLERKELPAPREVAVLVDRRRIPSWMLQHLNFDKEILWKL